MSKIVNDIVEYCYTNTNQACFYSSENYDGVLNRFITTLNDIGFDIEPCIDLSEHIQLFIEKYNWNMQPRFIILSGNILGVCLEEVIDENS